MKELMIRTNWHKRPILNAWELTEKERAEFDYYDGDYMDWPSSFFRYKGEVYDLSEFERVTSKDLREWDAYRSDTFFSGVVVRWVYEEDIGETLLIVGEYFA